MSLFDRLRQQKVLSLVLVMATLSLGIVIGTLINTGVKAEKSDKPITDATPLVVPPAKVAESQFSVLAKKLEPAVVHISTTYEAKPARTQERKRTRPPADEDEDQEDESMDLFRRFFRGPGGAPEMPRFKREGTGSGFIVDPKGYIITNHHVVDNADKITVKLHGDLTEYKAKLIGVDVETDLAIIKMDAGRALPFAPIGNSDGVEVGDWAIAIGSPFGLDASVTAGIVSAKGRDINAQQFQRFIQTDAAINPGNSGGPLLNIRGEVIGVNTMIATQSGGYQGIGFALPINMAVKVYNQLIKTGRVSRGSIGISWQKGQEKPELLKALGSTHGVIVEQVTPDGPAQQAGLRQEDIILSVNGKPVKDGEDLVARVADTPVGEKLKLTVDRAGKKMDFDVTVRDRAEVFKDDPRFARQRRPDDPVKEEGSEVKFGIYVRNLQSAERDEMKIEEERGVVVTRVQEGSFAEEIGLREKDVILSVNRQPVASVEDIRKVQGTLKPGDAVAFRVMRANPLARGQGAAPRYNGMFLSGTLPKN
ncbi:MAG: Do family serine endopeptidase [Bryobacterales bacterium]|nr:Do family serine endopeptidase [Bryobacterales bacterium]